MKPFKVRCFFCKESVLDITCDQIKVSRVINTKPMIREEKKVYRCKECEDKQKAKRRNTND